MGVRSHLLLDMISRAGFQPNVGQRSASLSPVILPPSSLESQRLINLPTSALPQVPASPPQAQQAEPSETAPPAAARPAMASAREPWASACVGQSVSWADPASPIFSGSSLPHPPCFTTAHSPTVGLSLISSHHRIPGTCQAPGWERCHWIIPLGHRPSAPAGGRLSGCLWELGRVSGESIGEGSPKGCRLSPPEAEARLGDEGPPCLGCVPIRP